eukprot:6211245-Pleurochrysis_carterae.AAC.1
MCERGATQPILYIIDRGTKQLSNHCKHVKNHGVLGTALSSARPYGCDYLRLARKPCQQLRVQKCQDFWRLQGHPSGDLVYAFAQKAQLQQLRLAGARLLQTDRLRHGDRPSMQCPHRQSSSACEEGWRTRSASPGTTSCEQSRRVPASAE